MGERENKARKLQQLFTGQKLKPPMERPSAFTQARPVKQRVKAAVSRQARNASRVFRFAMAGFMETPGLKTAMKGSELLKFYQKAQG